MLPGRKRIYKGLLFLAALTVVSLLGAPHSARANLQLYLQEDAGPMTLVSDQADFTAISYTNVFGDFNIKVFGGASDQGVFLSDLTAATTSVANQNGASHTLKLYLTQNNYVQPTGTPLAVESGLGGSITSGTLGLTGIFQAYADKNNNLAGLTDFTNGAQTAIANKTTFDTGSANGIFNRTAGSPYSLTSVTTLVISAGGKVNFANHIDVMPVPEPATLASALGGLVALGVLARARRRAA